MTVPTISPISVTPGSTVVRTANFDATAANDVLTGAATMYVLEIDNTANVAQAVYGKFYNNVAPTIGTTAPDMVIGVPGGVVLDMAILPSGFAFATSLSAACVTAGGTAGATGPTSNVVLAMTIA